MLPSLHTTARLADEAAAGAQLLIHNGDISCGRTLLLLQGLVCRVVRNAWLDEQRGWRAQRRASHCQP